MRRARTRARLQAVLTMLFAMVAWRATGHHAVLRFNLEETVVGRPCLHRRCVAIQQAGGDRAGPVAVTVHLRRGVLKAARARSVTFTKLGHPPPGAKGEPSSHGQAVRRHHTARRRRFCSGRSTAGDSRLQPRASHVSSGLIEAPSSPKTTAQVSCWHATTSTTSVSSAHRTRNTHRRGQVVHPGAAAGRRCGPQQRGARSVRPARIAAAPPLELIEHPYGWRREGRVRPLEAGGETGLTSMVDDRGVVRALRRRRGAGVKRQGPLYVDGRP